jgi:hypothetical protein
MNIPLTDTQTFVLSAAAEHPDLRIKSFPENVRGGAREKVLAALRQRALIRPNGDHEVLTDAGLAAVQPANAATAQAELPDSVSTLERSRCEERAAPASTEGRPPTPLAPEAEDALEAAVADAEAG